MKLITYFTVAFMLTVSTAQASTMTIEELVLQIQEIETQLANIQTKLDKINSQEGEMLGVTDDEIKFTIYVNNTVAYTQSSPLTDLEANVLCNNYAFDTKHMWQLVRCEHKNNTIYEDIFVAG